MLMSHSRIASFPETKFFARGFGGRRRWVLNQTLRGGYLWLVLARWLVHNGYMAWTDVHSLPVSWSKERMANIFRDMLDRLSLQTGNDVWVEKTPRHLHFIDIIHRHLPDAQFIHIVRDGRAVVASIHELAHTNPETWGQYRSVDRIIRRWNQCLRDSLHHISDDRHAIVSYDRVVQEPESVLRGLALFLDVQYEPIMIEEFHREAERVVKPHEAWKEDTTSSSLLEHSGLHKFEKVFSENEQAYVASNLDWSLYRDLGYQPL